MGQKGIGDIMKKKHKKNTAQNAKTTSNTRNVNMLKNEYIRKVREHVTKNGVDFHNYNDYSKIIVAWVNDIPPKQYANQIIERAEKDGQFKTG